MNTNTSLSGVLKAISLFFGFMAKLYGDIKPSQWGRLIVYKKFAISYDNK